MRFEEMTTAAIIDLIDHAAKNGGATILHCGPLGFDTVNFVSGYMVGGYSAVVTISNHDSDELCAALINNLIKAKNEEHITANEFLGLWVNEHGLIEVEYSRAYNNHWDAMKSAKKTKQRYIYDIANKRALKV